MEIKIYCPKCAQEYTVEDYGDGKPVECAKCKHVFKISKAVTTPPTKAAGKKPRRHAMAILDYALGYVFVICSILLAIPNIGNYTALPLIFGGVISGLVFCSIGAVIDLLGKIASKE